MIPRRMQRVVGDEPALAALWEKTRPLRDLQQIFVAVVPPYLRTTARVGTVTGDELRLFADSGAAATRLRLLAPGLLAEFRSRGWEFSAIRVAVQVRPPAPPVPQGPRRELDDQGRTALRRCADGIPPGPLRAALERLARNR